MVLTVRAARLLIGIVVLVSIVVAGRLVVLQITGANEVVVAPGLGRTP